MEPQYILQSSELLNEKKNEGTDKKEEAHIE